MAEALNISKSTYQSYDEGRRATPQHIIQLAQCTLDRSLAHSQRYQPGGELDQIITNVPMFLSDPVRE